MTICCGCYYIVAQRRQYLPQVELSAHTSVFATTSRTTLTQDYVNASDSEIKEMTYVFPLYDGVSVVSFRCTIGERVLTGVVKERSEAKAEYKAAVERGETAGLLEQSFDAADVFTTSIGNVGAGEKVKVEITYIGELKHDAEVDGVRFTLPTSISSRYGSTTDETTKGRPVNPKGISFTLDAEVPDGSAITAIRSQSHPIAVSVGTTSLAPNDAPSLRKASATLSLGSVKLGEDIIVQVVASNVGEPFAAVEQHPTLDTQALMVTLVPKFSLPAEKPEIVFICDRSGSMYSSITDLKEALRIFLKSLPVGVKFNICSFGSNYDFLWPKSRTYDQDSLAAASKHIETFQSNYGGTEMYEPMEAAFKQRFKDMNLEVFLLTDGEIWDQEKLFGLINKHVAESKGAIRVFTLGVGIGASTSLIEGVARAGNGFAQTTAPNEKMDKKVVRMLKGSLFPHIRDYSLDVKYAKVENKVETDDADDFELVEKISDSLAVTTLKDSDATTLVGDDERADAAKPADPPAPPAVKTSPVKKIISLFQKDLKDDTTDMASKDKFKGSKFAGLPKIQPPRYLSTPTEIPPLFPFNRTTAYVLTNDRSSVPTSVVLRGTSQAGPLELEIPVTVLGTAQTIHQLAARREMKELEEGRGWLSFAKEDGKLLSEKYEGHFADLAQREAVRLGTTFHVAGKYTSLVALQKSGKDGKDKDVEMDPTAQPEAQLQYDDYYHVDTLVGKGGAKTAKRSLGGGMLFRSAPMPQMFGAPPPAPCPAPMPAFGAAPAAPGGGGRFGAAPKASAMFSRSRSTAAPAASFVLGAPVAAEAAFDAAPAGSANKEVRARRDSAARYSSSLEGADDDGDDLMGTDIAALTERGEHMPVRSTKKATPTPVPAPVPAAPVDPLQDLTRLQTFVGSWLWSPELERVLGLTAADAAAKLTSLPTFAVANDGNNDILATACAVAYFSKKLAADKDAWEMMVDKAREWLAEQVGGEAAASALVAAAETLF
jgi:hypothetical protein